MALIIVPDDQPTPAAAVAAAVSGDHIGLRPNTYITTGLDFTGKKLFMFGMGDNPDDTVLDSSATAADGITLDTGGGVANLKLVGPGSNSGIIDSSTYRERTFINRVWVTGFYHGVYATGAWTTTCVNCRVWGCTIGLRAGTNCNIIGIHCTCVNNISYGYYTNSSTHGIYDACLGYGNGVADFANTSGEACNNVSGDNSLLGVGVQNRTGFDPANFVNYAGGDFDLVYPQNANGAMWDGNPRTQADYTQKARSYETGEMYAGDHDPYVAPVGGAPIGGAPTCLGIIDAAPAAQGCILIRFFEMVCDTGTVPYRYDIHVKQADSGVLTKAEIDACTYFARAIYQEDIVGYPNVGVSPPIGPAICSALIAFEAYSQHGDNVHLFTNRQYYVAVRAVAIDAADTIYEDDNDEVALSWSSGYQGIQWMHILSWPCLSLCSGQEIEISGIPNLNVGISSAPPVEFADDAELGINILDWPQLDAHIHRNRGG